MGDFFLRHMNDSLTEGVCFDTPQGGGRGSVGLALPHSLLRAKRRAAPKGDNSAAKGHCKGRSPVGPRPGPMELVFTPGGALYLVAPGLSTRRAFKGEGSAFASTRADVLRESPLREKRVESLRRQIRSSERALPRSGLSLRLSVRQPVNSRLIGWRTGTSDPSISP